MVGDYLSKGRVIFYLGLGCRNVTNQKNPSTLGGYGRQF